jgi:hypothetical protein
VLHVVGAAPRDLHRAAADRLRHFRGFDRVVPSEPASETAADERHVHGDVLRRDGKERGDVLADIAGRLRGRPDLAAIAPDVRHRIHRLDRRVRVERILVAALDALDRRRRETAVFTRGEARLCGGFVHPLRVQRGAELRIRAVLEHDVERLASFERGPRVVGNNGDAGADLYDRAHAGHFLRARGVERFHGAAEHRRTEDGRIAHARHAHVESVTRFAGDDVAALDALRRFADDAEITGAFQRDVGRHGQRRRRGHELAVRNALLQRVGDDEAALRAQRRTLDAEPRRRSAQQQLARGRTGLTQRLPLRGHAETAAGAEAPVLRAR